jgi:hypothetical protein
MNPAVVNLINLPAEPNFISDIQVRVLNSLMDIQRINKVLANQRQYGDKALSAMNYMTTLHKEIWRELGSGGPVVIESYRRGLQKAYFANLVTIATARDADSQETDAASLIKAEIHFLRQEITRAIPRTTDPLTLIHLKDLDSRINDLLNHKNG